MPLHVSSRNALDSPPEMSLEKGIGRVVTRARIQTTLEENTSGYLELPPGLSINVSKAATEAGGRNIRNWITQIRRVRHIVNFPAKFNLDIFLDCKIAEECGVVHKKVRATKSISSKRSEGSGCWDRKLARIE